MLYMLLNNIILNHSNMQINVATVCGTSFSSGPYLIQDSKCLLSDVQISLYTEILTLLPTLNFYNKIYV